MLQLHGGVVGSGHEGVGGSGLAGHEDGSGQVGGSGCALGGSGQVGGAGHKEVVSFFLRH